MGISLRMPRPIEPCRLTCLYSGNPPLPSASTVAEFAHPNHTEHAMSDYDEYDAYQDEVMREIRDEAMEYAANVQRSEEDGWFYSDIDEGDA